MRRSSKKDSRLLPPAATVAIQILAILALAFLPVGCGDDDDDDTPTGPVETEGTLQLSLFHQIGDDGLVFNEVIYVNTAGNRYSIETLKYYISDLMLHRTDGDIAFDIVHYVDPDAGEGLLLDLEDIPEGTYDSLSFTFGLDSTRNVTDGLPAEIQNLNMEWPEPLGGGYHYMKLEGKYLGEADEPIGYKSHTGRFTDSESGESFHHNFRVTLEPNIEIEGGKSDFVEIVMDVNEWYDNPNVIDLETHAGGVMNDTPAQNLMEANGQSVFRVGGPLRQVKP